MIKWSFYFEEGVVTSEVTQDLEDQRIKKCLEEPHDNWIEMPGSKMDMQINLNRVKLITRELVEDKVETIDAVPTDAIEVQPEKLSS